MSKFPLLIFSLLLLIACSDKEAKTENLSEIISVDTVIKHDTVYINNDSDWQEGFGLTHEPEKDSIWRKPVKFYIDNKNCSPIAIDFYFGEFRPTDNRTTATLLSLATTNDSSLRPFYRWCLNKTIQIQVGALAEYTGVPARRYAEKFPKEFFEYIDIDTTKGKYNDWVDAISYSGFYDQDDYKKASDIKKRLITTMKSNCNNCSRQFLNRIDQFAADCFQ
jgi:hypothetical protein